MRALCTALWLCAACAAQAHVGSPTVFFQGLAGSFPIRVTIQPPGVVPGLAQIHVQVTAGEATRVTVRPVKWDIGVKGSPTPDTAVLVPGETNLFTAQLWLMTSGAYSVFVDVSGPAGEGIAIVPLNSVATQRLVMTPGMSLGFWLAGALVLALLISVVGGAIREGRLPPGEQLAPLRRRRGWYARGITTAIIGLTLYFGNKWWDAVDKDYRFKRLYQPQAMKTELDTENGRRQLTLAFSPQSRLDATPLIPDHGHLMHLFLIQEPEGGVFAHLHPRRKSGDGSGAGVFTARLPDLPAGQYRIYADITHESGLTQTLTNSLTIPPAASVASGKAEEPADADDAVLLAPPAAESKLTFPGELHLVREFPGALAVNEETNLIFRLTTESGAEAPLEPYLGMYGHLIIESSDGNVFNHLHPLGSISMESQRRFAEREKAGFLANKPLDQFCTVAQPELSFPYAFPKAGIYRLWLQTKVAGHILTGAYSLSVK
jgi:hypothetical protein